MKKEARPCRSHYYGIKFIPMEPSDCGSVGRVFASESSHRQILLKNCV